MNMEVDHGSCDAIAAAIDGVDVESYVANRLVRSAVKREFVIVGEAINYLGDLAPEIFARITLLAEMDRGAD